MNKILNLFCERGQHCSCWFDGWWGDACKKHDIDYRYKAHLGLKIAYDLKLWYNVAISSRWLVFAGFAIGMIMFIGLTIFPKSYKVFKVYRKKLQGKRK